MAVEHDGVAKRLTKLRPQPVAQPAGVLTVIVGRCEGASRAETGCQQHALGAGSPPALMLGPVYQWLENDSSPDIQRADSFRHVQLMTDHRQQVDAKVIHRDWNLPNRLCGIRVNEHAALASDARDRQGAELTSNILLLRRTLRASDGSARRECRAHPE